MERASNLLAKMDQVLIDGGVVKGLCELDRPAALLVVEAGDLQDWLPALQAQMFHECFVGADGGYALLHAHHLDPGFALYLRVDRHVVNGFRPQVLSKDGGYVDVGVTEDHVALVTT